MPIIETARRLSGWYRPERVPYPINCTGVRPGERLHEILLSPNEFFSASAGSLPGLRSVRTRRDPGCLADVPLMVDRLRRLIETQDRPALARACLSAAEALQ